MKVRFRNAEGQIVQPTTRAERLDCRDGLLDAHVRAITGAESKREGAEEGELILQILALPFQDRYEPRFADWTESFAPGAFDDWLERVEAGEEDVQLLSGHWRDPLNSLLAGSRADGEGGAKVWVDKDGEEPGLYMEARLMADDPLSQRAYKLVESGLIRGASINFLEHDVEASREGDKTHFRVTKADVAEISLVDLPAYRETDIEIVGQRQEEPPVPHPASEREALVGEAELRKEIEDLRQRNTALEEAVAELRGKSNGQPETEGEWSIDHLLMSILK